MLVDRLLSVVCWWTHHNWVAVSATDLWCTVCHQRGERPPPYVRLPVDHTPVAECDAVAELAAERAEWAHVLEGMHAVHQRAVHARLSGPVR